MALQHAYAVTSKSNGRPSSAYTWSGGGASSNLGYLSDGRQDRQASFATSSSIGALKVDLGSAMAVDCLGLLHTNVGRLSGGVVIEVSAADDSGFTTGVVSVGSWVADTTRSGRYHQALQFSSQTKRYWLLSVTTSGNQTIYMGELFFGARTALSRAVLGQGNERAIEGKARVSESDAGQLYGHFFGGPQQRRTLNWADLSDSELAELHDMHAAASFGGRPLLWIEQYSAAATQAAGTRECLWGHFLEPSLTWTETDFGRSAARLTLKELSRGVGGGN